MSDLSSILRDKIENDFGITGEACSDLIDLVNIYIKKNDKDILIQELSEIY